MTQKDHHLVNFGYHSIVFSLQKKKIIFFYGISVYIHSENKCIEYFLALKNKYRSIDDVDLTLRRHGTKKNN